MSSRTNNPTHPGHFIKKSVIPEGVSVTAAAKAIGVGRPALSNLLNCKSNLSSDMAAKIEKAFGYSAKELLELQSDYEASLSTSGAATTASLPYIPPFLKATANQISEWAQYNVSSRTRFAVFLRTLVHSTCPSTSSVDFPGNDDGERPGWDGEVVCEAGNPWVPAGKSGWEFGTGSNYSSKANQDYRKSVKAVDAEVRKKTVFVFVTPHRWRDKSKWEDKKRAEGHWRDVRVHDASDLEQWLEQSLPAQTWFANETGVEYEGTLSLDRCWVKWNADCEPPFIKDIFEEAIATTGRQLADRLKDKGRVVRLAADSVEEGLAFLHALFNGEGELRQQRDRIIVFTKPGPLSKLATKTSRFIPIITTREVEKELSETGYKLGGIVLTPRTTEVVEKDVVLGGLSGEAFRVGLGKMGLGRDEVSKMSSESGRSLTVLRRRLSTSDAIRKPEWSNRSDLAKFLFPILLAGAWNSQSKADCIVLCELARIDDYCDLEDALAKLLALTSPPVWAVGGFRGVISKIDALYAICNWISEEDLRRFFSVADLVLSERDPSLDLPEENRWAAHIYDKARDISSPLRRGIADSLALLSMHGKELFFSRTGVNAEHLCANFVKDLLEPLNEDLLESQARDLPLYAEAAPDTFLKIFEKDLKTNEPVVFSLIRPATAGLFGRNPRSGLLWALENLAWSPNHLSRVLDILVRLSEIKLDDNWVNKPVETLRSIFRSWLPQTGAPLEQRIALLNRMIADNPDVAWTICKAELDPSPRFASSNHKPKWRDDAFGYGEGATHEERNEFVAFCIETALNWPSYNVGIMCDLIGLEDFVTDEHNEQMWLVLNTWAHSASDEDRAALREKIRTTIRRTMRRKKGEGRNAESDAHRSTLAKETYDALEPRDLIQKHSWLFKKHWVPEAWDEIEDDIDYTIRGERIQSLRDDAAQQVYQAIGFQGFVDLALLGEAAWVVGRCAGRVLSNDDAWQDFVKFATSQHLLAENFAIRQLIGGLFAEIEADQTCSVLGILHDSVDAKVLLELYCLAPFVMKIWRDVGSFDSEFQNTYWKLVIPSWRHHVEEDLQYATGKLLERGRPAAAFNFIRLDLKSVSSHQLYQVLIDMSVTREERCAIQTMEAYSIKQAIALLTERETHSQGELALLEFRYLAIYRDGREQVSNLQKEVSQNPSIFCDAVEIAFIRDDGTSDKGDADDLSRAAINAYRLLDALNRIPGTKQDGTVEADLLEEWIIEARRLCAKMGRRDISDYKIGELLSNAKVGVDGVWPCEGVRAVMDRLMTDSISRGFYIGTRNSRGAHFRMDEGGTQERELAEKYAGWASSIAYEYPNTATALRNIAESYVSEAEYEDNEAAIRKRMRY